MSRTMRQTLFAAVAVLATMMAIYVCYGRLSVARALAAGAGEDLVRCRELADSIAQPREGVVRGIELSLAACDLDGLTA